MSEELKPCPFCGKDATSFSEPQGWDVYGNNEYRAYAGCTNDKCGIGIDLWYTGDDMCDDRDDGEETASLLEDKAISIWNTRVEHTCQMKKARWDDGQCTWGVICSACGEKHEHGDSIKYCPKCGCRVRSNDE